MTAADRFFWLLLLLALVCYLLPWVVTPAAGLTMGAVDLAEWASLHPAVRAAPPPLLTSFLLRLPPVLLALVIASRPAIRRWLCALVVLLIAVALLPPLEFLTQYQDDLNYRQQFALALLALSGGTVGLIGRFARYRQHASSVLTLAAAGAALWGFGQTYVLLADFHVPLRVGVGVIGFAACCLALSVLDWLPVRLKTNRVARA
ncbi:MAG: hypothetical protein HZC41_17735 [Chloroflexi bacterium]|nr:hypothetical protein [Chloroflexota bacterium]